MTVTCCTPSSCRRYDTNPISRNSLGYVVSVALHSSNVALAPATGLDRSRATILADFKNTNSPETMPIVAGNKRGDCDDVEGSGVEMWRCFTMRLARMCFERWLCLVLGGCSWRTLSSHRVGALCLGPAVRSFWLRCFDLDLTGSD